MGGGSGGPGWDRGRMLGEMDDIILAAQDRKTIPNRAITSLPPWRALLYVRVAVEAGAKLNGGTIEELEAEVHKAVAEKRMVYWPPR